MDAMNWYQTDKMSWRRSYSYKIKEKLQTSKIYQKMNSQVFEKVIAKNSNCRISKSMLKVHSKETNLKSKSSSELAKTSW